MTLVFGELRFSGTAGVFAKKIRFSKNTEKFLLSGGCDSLWISPFQKVGDTVRIVCQRPRVCVHTRNELPEAKPKTVRHISSMPMGWTGLPSVTFVLREGEVVWEDGLSRTLRNFEGTVRVTEKGGVVLNVSGNLKGMGDNKISLHIDKKSQTAVSAELRINHLRLDQDCFPMVGQCPDLEMLVNGRIRCHSDDLECVKVDGEMEADGCVPGVLSLQCLTSSFKGSLSLLSRRLMLEDFHILLPEQFKLDGGKASLSREAGLEGFLDKIWVSGELVNRLPLLDQVDHVQGAVELTGLEFFVNQAEGLQSEGQGAFEVRDVGFVTYSEKLAAGNVDGRGRFQFTGDSTGLVVEAKGACNVGGIWLEDVEWCRLAAKGAIRAHLPSGVVSAAKVSIQTHTGAEISMEDSWVDLRSGRMSLNLEAPALRMDQLTALTPARTRESLSAMSLTGVVKAKASVVGYPAADRVGPGPEGLGAVSAAVDATLFCAGMEHGGIRLEVGDALRASVKLTARKSQTEFSVQFEGQEIAHSYRGLEAEHESIEGQASFLIDAPLGRVRVMSARMSLGEDVQILGAGEFSEYDMSLTLKGTEGPLSSWRRHLPEVVGLLPEMHKAQLAFEVQTRGPMGRVISGHAFLSDLEYLFAQSPNNALRMKQMRVKLSPMGMPRWTNETMETHFDATATDVVLLQEGRVLFEADSMRGLGQLMIDQGGGRILIEDADWRAEDRMSLTMGGELRRAREGYEGTLDLALPPFSAASLGELIPGFQPMDLNGILEAQGTLTLGEGTHFLSLQGSVHTHAPLDFHLSSTLFEGLEGELPFLHSFVGESGAPRIGQLRAKQIVYDETYIMENPLATGYYLDGTLVAEQCRFVFAKGNVVGQGSVNVFDDVPFDFSLELHEANIAELVEEVKPLMGSVFLGPIDGWLDGAGVRDRFYILEGRLESKGGWLSARQFQEHIAPLVPLRPLEEIVREVVGLFKNMRLEVDIYEEEGMPRYKYRIIDPMGLVKEKGESLITMPIDVLMAFIKKSEP